MTTADAPDRPPPPRRWWPLPLRARLALSAAVVVAVLLGAGGVFLIGDSRAALRRNLHAQVAAVAGDVAAQLAAGTAPADVAVRPAGSFPPPEVHVRDGAGHRVATLAGGFPFGLRGDGPVLAGRPLPPPVPPVADPDLLARDPRWATSAAGAAAGGVTYTVVAASPWSVVEPVLEPMAVRLRVGVPLAGLAAGLLAWWLARRALAPVEAIRAEAEAVTATSLARRVPEPPAGDEVGRLARTFNRMLGRLEAAQARQRQFVSDASHELRSPVAALRSSLEVAAAHPEATAWPSTVRDLLAVTARLERLVDDLLLLARQGEQGEPSSGDDVDLDDVVRAEVGLRPGAGLVAGPLPPARVRGSRRDLQRVVANLLDNAGRAATSQVEVGLALEAGAAVLWVDDDGPGIPPADRQRVFERFVRLDDGRARDGGGAGLGLAVVRETVAAHGGTVAAGDAPLGGARLTVTLPLATAARPEPAGERT